MNKRGGAMSVTENEVKRFENDTQNNPHANDIFNLRNKCPAPTFLAI